jgi:MFS family permease
MPPFRTSHISPSVWLTVIVCGLGYFVDIYDLILFTIVRQESLADLGVVGDAVLDASAFILNAQMVGMLLGGLLFGVLADRKGRLSVLLGSILLYSIMNIANAFVVSVPMYALFRFLSGIGLAGELGVAITLVAEIMPRNTRGYGTTLVASLGILGAVAAYGVHTLTDWRIAYIIGGVMGLALLFMRVRIGESDMFKAVEQTAGISRGNVALLFSPKRIGRYLSCVAVGVPIWYVIGILVAFSPEFTKESGGAANVVAGQGVMWAYIGLATGDLVSGLLSQAFRSRRRSVLLFLVATAITVTWYLYTPGKSAQLTYIMCGLLGVCVGYWAVFVTTAAEQFGTNLRATAATTIPNVVRGSLVPAMLAFTALKNLWHYEEHELRLAATVVGAVALALAFVGWLFLRETYGKDLNFVED